MKSNPTFGQTILGLATASLILAACASAALEATDALEVEECLKTPFTWSR